jgi:hypothetical protein
MQVFGTDYPTPDGTCIRDYIHVSDLVNAHYQALSYLRGGGESLTLNCGYGRGFSVLQVIEAMRRESGNDFPVELAARRPGDPAEIVASAERMRNLLGWRPQWDDLSVIVRHALAWERKLSAQGNATQRSATTALPHPHSGNPPPRTVWVSGPRLSRAFHASQDASGTSKQAWQAAPCSGYSSLPSLCSAQMGSFERSVRRFVVRKSPTAAYQLQLAESEMAERIDVEVTGKSQSEVAHDMAKFILINMEGRQVKRIKRQEFLHLVADCIEALRGIKVREIVS